MPKINQQKIISSTYEKLNDIKRQTTLGSFNNEHQKQLLDIIHATQSIEPELIFEELIHSSIRSTYPEVMKKVIEKINPYYFENHVLAQVLENFPENQDVPVLHLIYKQLKSINSIYHMNSISQYIVKLFSNTFYQEEKEVNHCVTFLIEEKIDFKFDPFSHKINLNFMTNQEQFKTYLLHVMDKCILLKNTFFQNYLKEMKRASKVLRNGVDCDTIEIIKKEYLIRQEKMYLENIVNTTHKPIKVKL